MPSQIPLVLAFPMVLRLQDCGPCTARAGGPWKKGTSVSESNRKAGRFGCKQARGLDLEGDVTSGQIRVEPQRGNLSPVVVAIC